MSELHTAKTQTLSTTRHTSSPERLSLKVNAPQHFKKKGIWIEHYTHKEITILLSEPCVIAAFKKKVELNIDVYKQCTELVVFFFLLCQFLAMVPGISVLNFK